MNKGVGWSSSDDSIATVDRSGKVTTHKAGTATIVVTTDDGGYTAECAVTVVDASDWILVTGVTLDRTSAKIEAGETLQLTAEVQPDNATSKGVSWSSSDEAIAPVDQNGEITAKAPGKTTISVTTDDGGKNATCEVTVTAPAGMLWLSGLPQNGTVYVGDNIILTPQGAADTNTGKTGWSWDRAYLSATFNSPATFTALKAGTTNITYTASDGQKATATITILVKDSTGSGTTRSGSNSPRTGDESNLALWLGVATVAGTALLYFLQKRRKNRRADI